MWDGGATTGKVSEATPLASQKRRRLCCGATSRVRTVTSITSFAEGFDVGVINGALVLLREDLHLSSWEVGVVLAIFAVGIAGCAPLAGSLADMIGRKPTLIVSNLLLIAGGVTMATANSFESMIIGRFLAGAGVGFGITTVTTYMSEVAPAGERGFYGSLEEIFNNFGLVSAYLVNVFLLGVPQDWRYMLATGVIPASLAFVMLILPTCLSGIPESPRYLQKAGMPVEARAALADFLDGDMEEVEIVLKAWAQEAVDGMASWSEAFAAFCGSRRRAALAGIGAGILNTWTGIAMLNVMATSLLVHAGMGTGTAMKVSLVLGAIKTVVMLLVALLVLDTWGRRPLLLWSLGFCSIASAVGGVGSLLPTAHVWQVVGLCLFATGFAIGVGPVPWVYLPEVMDNRFRGKGVALGLTGSRIVVMVQLQVLPVLMPAIGISGFFICLLVLNISGFLYAFGFCPETKDSNLEDMHLVFQARSLRRGSVDFFWVFNRLHGPPSGSPSTPRTPR